MCWPEGDVDTPTITDCHVVLGHINPEYFLGGEILLNDIAVQALADNPSVTARSDWGIDTLITHATATLGLGIYEHNVPDGKRHALYGSLSELEDMVLECLDAVASLRASPWPNAVFDADPPTPVPDDLKTTVAYDLSATRQAIAAAPGDREIEILSGLGIDPTRPIEMDARLWAMVFPMLLDRFRLDDRDWRSVAFRLWVERVIHHTIHQVSLGYDHAMEYLEQTVRDFESF
jgi:hypothetical protein